MKGSKWAKNSAQSRSGRSSSAKLGAGDPSRDVTGLLGLDAEDVRVIHGQRGRLDQRQDVAHVGIPPHAIGRDGIGPPQGVPKEPSIHAHELGVVRTRGKDPRDQVLDVLRRAPPALDPLDLLRPLLLGPRPWGVGEPRAP